MKKIGLLAVALLWILAGIKFLLEIEEKNREKVIDVLGDIGEQETAAILKCESVLPEGTYLFWDIDFQEDVKKAFMVREDLKKEQNSTINVIGSYNGRLLLSERNEKVDEILDRLKAEVISEYRSEEFFTVYAYSPYIADYKMQKGQAVNLNIALQYDEEKDQTFIYAAVPVLGLEY